MKVEQTLHQTKDYSIFKILKSNRNTSSNHVLKLETSINEKNLTIDYPIIVNKNYEVLDGQHRLEACKQLNAPIWYKFAIEMTEENISTVNSMGKSWSLKDYLNRMVGRGNENYIKFKEFMEWGNCNSENVALKILNNIQYTLKDSGIGAGGDLTNKFKIGKFIYPANDNQARKYVIQLKRLSEFTTKKNPYDRSLVSALDLISKTKNFDFDRLLSKLQNYPIGVYRDYATLIDNLEKAYNYNVQNDKKIFLNKAA